jgi:uncharacterized OB-fold protein
MPVCPNCGAQQRDGDAYCDACGAELEGARSTKHTPITVITTCPVCGTPALPDEPFCDHCGASLRSSAPEPPTQADAPAPSPPPPPTPREATQLACPHCGAHLEPGSNFCDMCGTPVNAATLTKSSVQVPLRGRLVIRSTNTTLILPPDRAEAIIGREDPASRSFPDIDLTNYGGDEGGVSRRHARIFAEGDQILVEDLDSTNLTHVNRKRLKPGHPHPLSDGDEVWFGRVKADFFFK